MSSDTTWFDILIWIINSFYLAFSTYPDTLIIGFTDLTEAWNESKTLWEFFGEIVYAIKAHLARLHFSDPKYGNFWIAYMGRVHLILIIQYYMFKKPFKNIFNSIYWNYVYDYDPLVRILYRFSYHPIILIYRLILLFSL